MAQRTRAQKSPPPKRVRDDARALYRAAILDAAEAVFSERGVTAARMQDVAARAGMAVGTIYNYFEQKEDILFALLSERASAFVDAFEPLEDDPKEFADRLLARMIRVLEYIAEHRAFFALASDYGLFGTPTTGARELMGGRTVPHAGQYESAILALVDEGQRSGVLANCDRELLALQLRHTIRTGSQWQRARPDIPVKDAAKAVVELYLRGAAKRPKR